MTGAAVNKTKQAVEPESSKASEEIDEPKRLPLPKTTVGVIAERSALVNAEQATSQPTPLNDEQVMQDHDGQVSPVDVKKVTPVDSELAKSVNVERDEPSTVADVSNDVAPAVAENRLFMGNPGTGKSTLINCLVGRTVFQSGLSWGGGLTKDYQKYVAGDIAYMDTPGLADRTILEQAAKAITKALSEPGDYKLFFMVRMQAGRIVSEDLVTVERVLDSIDVPDLKFSILVNNLGRRQYDAMMQFGAEFKKVMALMNQGKYSTPHVCFIPTFRELEESDNQTIELPKHSRRVPRVAGARHPHST
ncbi:hypothetical protein PINS_up022490 [Pythium insidiosum]|nr:hypothetical protein PINS_up022490 [Pythium insidiosum]